MVAAILGASVDTGVLPPIVHAMIAYGAIACNLAAAEDRDRRAHRVQPHRRRGQPPDSSRDRAPSSSSPDVSKDYGGLRPLRIARAARARRRARRDARLRSADGRSVREPRHRRDAARPGEVSVFGRPTRAIADSADWLAIVDRFGIVSERAVLLEALTVVQNLAMPFTLEIEPPPDDVRRRAEALAREVGLPEASWTRPVGELDAGRHGCACALGRALALDPAIVLLEHPSAGFRARRSPPLGAEHPRGRRPRRGDRARRADRPTRRSPQAVADAGADARAGDRPSQGAAAAGWSWLARRCAKAARM